MILIMLSLCFATQGISKPWGNSSGRAQQIKQTAVKSTALRSEQKIEGNYPFSMKYLVRSNIVLTTIFLVSHLKPSIGEMTDHPSLRHHLCYFRLKLPLGVKGTPQSLEGVRHHDFVLAHSCRCEHERGRAFSLCYALY